MTTLPWLQYLSSVYQANNHSNLAIIHARIVQKLVANPTIGLTFDITPDEIQAACKLLILDDKGIDLSPMFMSPGFGEAGDYPLVALSDIDLSDEVLFHEFLHFLHYFICCRIFILDDTLATLQLFSTQILEDSDFIEHIAQNGNVKQLHMLDVAKGVVETYHFATQLDKYALLLGALTYQHAFFVDPGMCEAVASTQNTGHLKLVHFTNRSFGRLIPGDQYLDGYGNLEWQALFTQATPHQKALLVRKCAYNRELFFSC